VSVIHALVPQIDAPSDTVGVERICPKLKPATVMEPPTLVAIFGANVCETTGESYENVATIVPTVVPTVSAVPKSVLYAPSFTLHDRLLEEVHATVPQCVVPSLIVAVVSVDAKFRPVTVTLEPPDSGEFGLTE
jgi:hypothetical protein